MVFHFLLQLGDSAHLLWEEGYLTVRHGISGAEGPVFADPPAGTKTLAEVDPTWFRFTTPAGPFSARARAKILVRQENLRASFHVMICKLSIFVKVDTTNTGDKDDNQ